MGTGPQAEFGFLGCLSPSSGVPVLAPSKLRTQNSNTPCGEKLTMPETAAGDGSLCVGTLPPGHSVQRMVTLTKARGHPHCSPPTPTPGSSFLWLRERSSKTPRSSGPGQPCCFAELLSPDLACLSPSSMCFTLPDSCFHVGCPCPVHPVWPALPQKAKLSKTLELQHQAPGTGSARRVPTLQATILQEDLQC